MLKLVDVNRVNKGKPSFTLLVSTNLRPGLGPTPLPPTFRRPSADPCRGGGWPPLSFARASSSEAASLQLAEAMQSVPRNEEKEGNTTVEETEGRFNRAQGLCSARRGPIYPLRVAGRGVFRGLKFRELKWYIGLKW